MGLLTDYDMYLFHQGTLYHAYNKLGAHPMACKGVDGVRFTVWAPHAKNVRVSGDFNDWHGELACMNRVNEIGVWSLFIPLASVGDHYKYEIHTWDDQVLLKADPYAFHAELRPGTASKVVNLDAYKWNDEVWQEQKLQSSPYEQPMSIYEVHLGTWKKKVPKSEDFYTYRELAEELIPYVVEMGYTHIELLPLAEHPFDRSWGYQATGYYAVTSRYGTPDDFKYFVDCCHQQGIGVIMDWVPGHFCKDDHGLRLFDGDCVYEYEDPRKAEKPEWGTLTFDYGKPEVRSFLISNAVFWMEVYHIDGIRVDAVASMLYTNFGKPQDLWVQENSRGDNPHAVALLQQLNQAIFARFPHALMMAEDSSSWPKVTAPVHEGGLGFNYKWNMGWMNDMLKFMEESTVHRKWHHHLITFSFMYAFSENYVLPLSHDEVVHGKRSLLHKMPGDYWQKFANLRAFYGYMMAHPGKKLLFMGGEIGQFDEWKDLECVDWFLLEYDSHRQMQEYVKALNHFYKQEKALWEQDHSQAGFKWINPHDSMQSIAVFLRMGKQPMDQLLYIGNFTEYVHANYRVGVPNAGVYAEVFNSDQAIYGGSGQCNSIPLVSEPIPWNGMTHSIMVRVPPLASVFLRMVTVAPERADNEGSNEDEAKRMRSNAPRRRGRKKAGGAHD
ncbi:1,4-alpha-glucan branching protein GlgB [Paenibacillus sp. N1-5-1-14]|uniref:1,4-alpha-glucan branching protein GlgB n=1 Tax=Paenibacillus radicibacter TaxID=2972488 RepID=UPI002159A293|nr:1,4-alpha-glucan branching protein GlgB [Paenibacillus radicibacter]MCR8641675.1 1,4-alpha-glucan branching protein GlgB [Paenibacillus radicibacter]